MTAPVLVHHYILDNAGRFSIVTKLVHDQQRERAGDRTDGLGDEYPEIGIRIHAGKNSAGVIVRDSLFCCVELMQ